jgi:hypothetical protein
MNSLEHNSRINYRVCKVICNRKIAPFIRKLIKFNRKCKRKKTKIVLFLKKMNNCNNKSKQQKNKSKLISYHSHLKNNN